MRFSDALLAFLLCLPLSTPASEISMNQVSGPSLTIERLYQSPILDGPQLQGLCFSPMSDRVTFLKGKENDYRILDLWEYDLGSGEQRLLVDSDTLDLNQELSEEEKARRERKRVSATGIVEYTWHPNGQGILFPANGSVYFLALGEGGALKRVTPEGTSATDVRFSPKGRYVSYVHDQNLWLHDLESGKTQALTQDGGGTLKYGMAEYVAQEEMDRDTGYWWSGDERQLAYTRVDESAVVLHQRPEFMADEMRILEQRYPFTGTANAKVDLLIQDLETGQVVQARLGEADQYLARVNWMPDHKHLGVQLQTRDQKRLGLFQVDTQTGLIERTLVVNEGLKWVELHHDLHFLEEGGGFIWSSAASGFKHLYLHGADGSRIRALTTGDWPVKKLLGVDEKANRVYFSGFAGDPMQQHLYAVPLMGDGPMERLTERDGWHDVTLSKDHQYFLDPFSSPIQPPQVSLHRISGECVVFLEENALKESHPFFPYVADFVAPEYGSLEAEDGQTLYYKLTKPARFDPAQQYPAVVFVYGGPHARRVVKDWDRHTAWTQFMAQQGYVVFSLDNRGSADRGTIFEESIHGRLGEVEIADQRRGGEFLQSLGYVNPGAIGVFGWSYGGYATLMCLAKAGDVFKAGVSVAPVTDWGLYDTHYTERYLGTPQENAEGYEASSVFPYLDHLKGNLLLVHGMADDNVLFTHTTRLIKAMQDRDIPFDVQMYPGSKHGIAERQARVHLYHTMTRFFDRSLKGT